MTDRDAIQFRLRRCWVRKDNRRLSSEYGPWPRFPSFAALVLEWVEVHETMRQNGVFSRFLTELLKTPDTELFIVEAVQNPHLAEALLRRGWECDPASMDFYWFPESTP